MALSSSWRSLSCSCFSRLCSSSSSRILARSWDTFSLHAHHTVQAVLRRPGSSCTASYALCSSCSTAVTCAVMSGTTMVRRSQSEGEQRLLWHGAAAEA